MAVEFVVFCQAAAGSLPLALGYVNYRCRRHSEGTVSAGVNDTHKKVCSSSTENGACNIQDAASAFVCLLMYKRGLYIIYTVQAYRPWSPLLMWECIIQRRNSLLGGCWLTEMELNAGLCKMTVTAWAVADCIQFQIQQQAVAHSHSIASYDHHITYLVFRFVYCIDGLRFPDFSSIRQKNLSNTIL